MDFTIGKARHLTTFNSLTGDGLAAPLAIAATGLIDFSNGHFSNGAVIGEVVSYFVSTCKRKVKNCKLQV
jgi:hypothetical protein